MEGSNQLRGHESQGVAELAKRSVLALLTGAATLLAQPVSAATSLSVINHSFEDPAQSPSGFVYSSAGPIPGWSTTATGGADRGVWYTAAPGKLGNQIGFAYTGNAFAQDLAHNILADTVYQVDFLYGRVGSLVSELTVELWAGGSVDSGAILGGTLLGSLPVTPDDLSDTVSGSLYGFGFSYMSPSAGSPVGQNLSIRLVASGTSYSSFDDIRVSYAQPIPEPETYAMLLAGLGLVAWRTLRSNAEHVR